MKTKRYESMPGNHIYDACNEAVAIAMKEKCCVTFDFNGIELTAKPFTNPAELTQYYRQECEKRRAAYLASPEHKAREDEYERKESEKKAKSAGLLANAPASMTLKDPEGWRKACDANQDSYGGEVMTYAERWARLMEASMACGEKLAEIAEECSHIADEEGITGFMYGAAVSTLSRVWIHGEELRVWHNLKFQLKDEGKRANESGAVLNPATLTIN